MAKESNKALNDARRRYLMTPPTLQQQQQQYPSSRLHLAIADKGISQFQTNPGLQSRSEWIAWLPKLSWILQRKEYTKE
jgi:hypothetical protein